jgi:uncharacterized membrane protein YjgN (DUF898 family)
MDMMTAEPPAHERAIRFTGSWREYLPIAASNVLLILVTLGIYRFWAAARQRRYLWSRTEVIGDRLEWSGTGKEMFIGFLIVSAVLLPFFLFFQFLLPAMVARGKEEAAFGIVGLFYFALIYLGGVARFRALRYRLSRTWWRGIRGGSDEPGWSYGGEYLMRIFAALMTMWIAWPWMATALFARRWSAMGFGSLKFHSSLEAKGLGRRWAAIYLIPLGLLVGLVMIGFAVGSVMVEQGDVRPASVAVMIVGVIVLVYLAIPLLTLHWYAKYYRMAAETLSLGELEFGFDARTRDWLKLFLGNIALAVVTLGLGLSYWGYRNWAFMVRHMHLYGEINVTALRQSTTRAPTEAEGFADAFDIGAI